MLSRLLIRLVAALCAASCLAVPSQAMIFTEVEPVDLAGTGMRLSRMILGSGPIQPGDPQRFGSFMADRPRTHHFAGVQWGFALNSPGGNLMEGLRLGGGVLCACGPHGRAGRAHLRERLCCQHSWRGGDVCDNPRRRARVAAGRGTSGFTASRFHKVRWPWPMTRWTSRARPMR